MKKVRVLAGLILCFAMIFAMVGCGEQKNPEWKKTSCAAS